MELIWLLGYDWWGWRSEDPDVLTHQSPVVDIEIKRVWWLIHFQWLTQLKFVSYHSFSRLLLLHDTINTDFKDLKRNFKSWNKASGNAWKKKHKGNWWLQLLSQLYFKTLAPAASDPRAVYCHQEVINSCNIALIKKATEKWKRVNSELSELFSD